MASSWRESRVFYMVFSCFHLFFSCFSMVFTLKWPVFQEVYAGEDPLCGRVTSQEAQWAVVVTMGEPVAPFEQRNPPFC